MRKMINDQWKCRGRIAAIGLNRWRRWEIRMRLCRRWYISGVTFIRKSRRVVGYLCIYVGIYKVSCVSKILTVLSVCVAQTTGVGVRMVRGIRCLCSGSGDSSIWNVVLAVHVRNIPQLTFVIADGILS
jgi:hypothetical protein